METVYCVKYALTVGIFKVVGKPTSDGYFSEKGEDGRRLTGLFLGRNDWVRSWDEAVIAAEKKLDKKITSLEKQLIKLRKITFVEVQRP
jgi:hypothetical protein